MTFFILLSVGIAGLVAHWFKKWARGQTNSTFVEYMQSHKKHSASSVVTMIGSVIALYSTGDVELTKQVIATVFLIGYSIDSALNKTPEES